jgi:streptogramin lyase
MGFMVVVCERATGIVCHPDGRRWLTTDGCRFDPEFLSWDETGNWCRELQTIRADLECWVYDEAGQAMAVFR